MKTIAFITGICLMALLLPVLAFGNPFLVCDPQAGVVFYDLETNSTVTEGIPAEPDGSIKFDLATMPVGQYTFKVRAIGQGGWPSDWSLPLDATKPANPLNLRVSSE